MDNILSLGGRWRIIFVEASANFRAALSSRYPAAIIRGAQESGVLAVESMSVDLVVALSVLRHIPNVSFVLSEFARVLRPGGFAVVREPCSSMGDRSAPRSATPNERGIPMRWLLNAAGRAGLEPARPPLPILVYALSLTIRRMGLGWMLNTTAYYWTDVAISWTSKFNDDYFRNSLWKKFAPSAYFYVLSKSHARGGEATAHIDGSKVSG